MPTFCRHNRFIERCPICARDLPELAGAAREAGSAARPRAARKPGAGAPRALRERGGRGEHVRVRQQERASSDGYASALLPGVHSSADAQRLAQEMAFANGRLLVLAAQPPGLYGELRELAANDLERATWGCFLAAYLSPLEPGPEGGDAFAGIREALSAEVPRELPDLEGIALGPRSSHERSRGNETLEAYVQWAQRGGAPGVAAPAGQAEDGARRSALAMRQAEAFRGDPSWTPERRFQRLYERLALPGLGRAGRYELLVLLGRLGLYELRADSLALAGARGAAGEDLTGEGAKRVFAIGDPLLLERRAGALARAAGVPVEALDLALANWAAGERASLGVRAEASDEATLERALAALGL
jgi:hypothetical protein